MRRPLLQSGSHIVEPHPQIRKNLARHPLALAEQPEQYVFGPYMRMTKSLRLPIGRRHNGTRMICKTLPHCSPR